MEFENKYPTTCEYVATKKGIYPEDVEVAMVLKISILMALFSKGRFNAYLRVGQKMDDTTIDIFTECYVRSYCGVLDTLYAGTGSYDIPTEITNSNPETYVIKMIRKYGNETK